MSATFQDMLSDIKSKIREITVHELRERLASNEPPMLFDIREPEEHQNGVIEGARTLPRGYLELKIESLVPDRKTPVAIYCAGGTRSALGAHALQQLGYQDVVNVEGGIGAWSRAGYPLEHRRMLTNEQKARYARQIILPQMGEEGQQKLLNAKVLCVGAGGLGSPTALYLAAAGVGTLGIVDNDKADLSNLQRQIIHTEESVGTSKVESAKATLSRLNSDITINVHDTRLDSSNVMEIFRGYDIVVDGTDNFPTRYLINDACVFLGLPNVHGSIFHFDGQVTVFNAGGDKPCYRCLYPEPPPPELAPSCAEAGVLGAICGIIGTMQAAETMKLILGAGDLLAGRVLSIDVLRGTVRELKTRKDPSCPVCSANPTITELIDYEEFCSLNAH
ncbi:MAG: molybdopterin-synthase adenylyltransferase MoeB [Deltaproteobacteria bacterium]|nr:molybdopterin-synthase adenylyltransferase MoeB [Deltaproteobacteria bacterium]